jgi:hypothetical protein
MNTRFVCMKFNTLSLHMVKARSEFRAYLFFPLHSSVAKTVHHTIFCTRISNFWKEKYRFSYIQGVSKCFPWLRTFITKETKGPIWMELFTATGKTEKISLTTRDVRCVHHRWHDTHRYDIQVLATHVSTWVRRHSSLLQWSVPLGQRGHVAMVGRIFYTKYTLHSNHRLTVWYSNTQNDISPGAAIFSLHKLASPSGRNMNYDEKQLNGGKNFWVVPSICTGFVNTCPTVFL